jgi:hypothetical protein
LIEPQTVIGQKIFFHYFSSNCFALSRPKANFNPDAYSHGGISIQEMLVPMLAMRVKGPEEGLLIISPITGKIDLIEGEEAEFRMKFI